MEQNLSTIRKAAGSEGEPTIALALGGGGARGLAHIHVIEALDEMGLRPAVVAGSSIGALMGAGVAAGMSGKEIREHVLSTVGRRGEVLNRLWRLRPTSLAEAVASGFRVGQFNIERVLKAFLPEAVPLRFSDLALPLKSSSRTITGRRSGYAKAATSTRRSLPPAPCRRSSCR